MSNPIQGEGVIRLAEGLYFVEGEGRGQFPRCNGFVLAGTETILVDSGIGPERIRRIDRQRRIDALVISHSHPDHIYAWEALSDRRILLPEETPDSVCDLYLLGLRFCGAPEGAAHWARLVHDAFGVRAMRPPDGRYRHGDVFDLGHMSLEAIHAPGHISDHYCFFERRSGTLLTTDVDFNSFGPWYANPEADIEVFKQTVRELAAYQYKRVCSSHRRPIEGDADAGFYEFLAGFDRHRQLVLELCDFPRTPREIASFSPFYNNRLPDKVIQAIFEERMVRKHLDILARDGLVEEQDSRYHCTGGGEP
jgi:glyoxylase-like metal-dependent hydrolase (beta-lactamase superfamily II)